MNEYLIFCLQPLEMKTSPFESAAFLVDLPQVGGAGGVAGQNDVTEQSRDLAAAAVGPRVKDSLLLLTPQRAHFQAFCEVGRASFRSSSAE